MLFAQWERQGRPYPWSHQTFHEALLHGCPTKIFVLEQDQAPVCFAAVHRAAEEAYLSNLMTSPQKRRHGFAEFLVQKVMIWAKEAGATELVLDVDPNNGSAVTLYKKLGFDIIEHRHQSYPRGEDALMMRRQL